MLLTGLSDFLTERAQVELGAWVYASLEDQLCETDTSDEPARGGVLPSTCALVKANTLRFTSAGIGVLRGTARADLRSLPRRVVEQAWCLDAGEPPTTKGTCPGTPTGSTEPSTRRQRQRDQLLFAAVTLRMAELLAEGADPLEVSSAWTRSAPWSAANREGGVAALSLYALGALTAAIPREGAEARLLDTVEPALPDLALASLINLNDRGVLTDLAGLWAPFTPKAGDTDDPTKQAARLLGPLRKGLRGIDRTVRRLVSTTKALAALPADAPPERRRALAVQLTIGGMDLATEGLAVGLSLDNAKAAAERGVLEAARRRLAMVREITAGLTSGDLGALGAAITPLIIELQANNAPANAQSELDTAAVRALAFATALGQASDPRGAQAAIEAFVAPPGGYARKRLDYAGTKRYLTLQSYVGLSGGGEWALKPANSGVAAVAAPLVSLGAEVGKPIGTSGWAGGIYVPVLDLGGLAATRFGDAQATAPVNVRQVLSPGLYATLGLPKSPVSLGLGAALRPGLRENADGDPASAVQFGGFFAMDLVLLP